MRPRTTEEWELVVDVIDKLQRTVRAGDWDELRRMVQDRSPPVDPPRTPAEKPAAKALAEKFTAELDAKLAAKKTKADEKEPSRVNCPICLDRAEAVADALQFLNDRAAATIAGSGRTVKLSVQNGQVDVSPAPTHCDHGVSLNESCELCRLPPETNATPRATYVCPQCGPDPAGEELHAKRSHALDSLFATAHETVRERHNPLREPVEHCSVCGEPGCPDHM